MPKFNIKATIQILRHAIMRTGNRQGNIFCLLPLFPFLVTWSCVMGTARLLPLDIRTSIDMPKKLISSSLPPYSKWNVLFSDLYQENYFCVHSSHWIWVYVSVILCSFYWDIWHICRTQWFTHCPRQYMPQFFIHYKKTVPYSILNNSVHCDHFSEKNRGTEYTSWKTNYA